MRCWTVIEVRNLHKSFRDTVAVAGVSFELQPSQILALVGPNGAGKTTTMRVIAGLLNPTLGEIRVAGQDVQRQSVEAKRRLAYIPDDPQLFSDLSVAQHMAFTAGAYCVADAQAKSLELLTQFELFDKRDTRARDLSRGMRQKLAICCAYLHRPQVLLCDEPMTGLDPEGIRTLKQSIQERAQEGAAIIVSSHLLAMLEDVCSHVLVLRHGRSRFWGPLDEFKAAYRGHGGTLEESFFEATREDAAAALPAGALATTTTDPSLSGADS